MIHVYEVTVVQVEAPHDVLTSNIVASSAASAAAHAESPAWRLTELLRGAPIDAVVDRNGEVHL